MEITPADAFEIVTSGEGSDLPADETHIAARIARAVAGNNKHRIVVDSNIPVSRGLGSSAALALATAAAAGASDPLAVALAYEGHADNAAAAAYGGLISAVVIDGRTSVMQHSLDSSLAFVVIIPDHPLSTSEARAALPATVPLTDAVANVSRIPLVLKGLAHAEALVSAAGDDTLHQPYRTKLFPESVALMDAMRNSGARMTCWSGAGSTLLGICASSEDAQRVREAGEKALVEAGVSGHCEVLLPDFEGLRFEGSGGLEPLGVGLRGVGSFAFDGDLSH